MDCLKESKVSPGRRSPGGRSFTEACIVYSNEVMTAGEVAQAVISAVLNAPVNIRCINCPI